MSIERLRILKANSSVPDVVLIDGLQLIYHVVWPSSGTVSDLAAGMGPQLIRYNTKTVVIFCQRPREAEKSRRELQRVPIYIDNPST